MSEVLAQLEKKGGGNLPNEIIIGTYSGDQAYGYWEIPQEFLEKYTKVRYQVINNSSASRFNYARIVDLSSYTALPTAGTAIGATDTTIPQGLTHPAIYQLSKVNTYGTPPCYVKYIFS